MVEATARDGAFIADFLRPSARLRKAKMGDPPPAARQGRNIEGYTEFQAKAHLRGFDAAGAARSGPAFILANEPISRWQVEFTGMPATIR
jgi:hypothetical protein